MSALEPGLYRATVRGVADVIVQIGDDGYGFTARQSNGAYLHPDGFVTDARPLIVLDLEENDARHLVSYLEITVERHPDQLGTVGRAVYTNVAAQVAQQTKPARIPEPGLWGVVDASYNTGDRCHWTLGSDGLWHSVRPPFTGVTVVAWDLLIDPTLIREGVTE